MIRKVVCTLPTLLRRTSTVHSMSLVDPRPWSEHHHLARAPCDAIWVTSDATPLSTPPAPRARACYECATHRCTLNPTATGYLTTQKG